jgi:hypothetical protein
MCKSKSVAAIACNPLPSANPMLFEPNPYQIYVLEDTEPLTCPRSGADPNDSDGTPQHNNGVPKPNNGSEDLKNVALASNPDNLERCILVKTGESHVSKILGKHRHWERCFQIQ